MQPHTPQRRETFRPTTTPPPTPTSILTNAADAPLTPPPPPPPPPPPLLPLTVQAIETNTEPHTLSPFIGTLESLQRAALSQRKWIIVILLPPNRPLSLAALPSTPTLHSSVLVWRRQSTASEAARYTAFFPVDGYPHIALLDPRSGERLLIWGNRHNVGMVDRNLDPTLWHSVLHDLTAFVPLHSLHDMQVGPVHMQQKTWAACTRRVASADATPAQLANTAVMDDEEAAIAAAIAASLRDAEASCDNSVSLDDDVSDSEDEQAHNAHQSRHEIDPVDRHIIIDGHNDFEATSDSSALSRATLSATTADTLSQVSDPGPLFHALPSTAPVPTSACHIETAVPSKPVDIARMPSGTPSSIDSLSSSYLERMASCLRSSTNPELLEARRLRQEQDDELLVALQSDRAREAEEETCMRKSADKKERLLEADRRLGEEPTPDCCSQDVVSIALRLPNGSRVCRMFWNNDCMRAIADFCIVSTDGELIPACRVDAFVRAPGMDMKRIEWSTPLAEVGFGKGAALTVQP